ncbi:Chitin synthase activator (Chs3) [Penicillium maclennaniae]|uniref:Chitin synthase activator (Chs3) n=1 Tax=Penicillium maclennaniae TaxID=1343394 RepID=UPI00253F9145|nr:Chitin synthase activator (Chs3) [Penicillium maclennaniae]KAJ5667953.1 Chitin synthase activator (Chs3) [Penicillium maclennaniae]
MPKVRVLIRPSRVMPEVPENMQDNIAQMEHHARDPRRPQQPPAQYRPQQQQQQQQQFPERSSSTVQAQPQQSQTYDHGSYAQAATYDSMDHPNFSPFPILRSPPPNVPPTDEQREAKLEHHRMSVLSTTDPEMQLSWAQDALAFVEVAAQNEARLALTQPPRPHTPQIEQQLKTDALNIVSFLAEQHHPKAEFIKGMWLEFGKFGYRVDRKEAFRCYSRAAEKGYARAEYRIGMQFESSGEPEKAIRHYERGVAMADSASYYRLGMMILLGQHGQRQDFQKGLEYIRLAAQSCDQNAPQGAYVYGMLLARELPQVSVPEPYLALDLNIARVNIEKAAYHGFAKAQVKMGAAYELCQLNCDFNPALSLHYNALAARQGEPEAEMAISKWFLCGHEGVFEKNDELAFTYAQRAAQSGLPTAEFALGYFYEVGIFVPVDIKEARGWYAKAAASGNKDASGRIDSISRSKTLSRRDHEKVAISRIKSTRYVAHQRGGSLESTPENIQMPDPSRMTLNDQPSSAAPYPDRPGTSRPRPPGQPSYQMPDPRPSSAFGVNPNLRQNGPPSYGGPQGPPGPRTPTYGQPPMNYRQPGSGAGTPLGAPTGPASPQAPNMISPNGTPRVDIGYSAPAPRPGDRRPTRLDSAPPQGGPPDRRPVRTPVSAPGGICAVSPTTWFSFVFQLFFSATRVPFICQFPSPTTRFSFSRQPSRGSSSSTPQPPSAPPSSASGPPSVAPSKPPQSSKPSGQAPSKGPKTFEEMGVPSAKNDSDCAIEVSANLHNKVTKGERYRPTSLLQHDLDVSPAQAAKILRVLHQDEKIEERVAGKQSVYHAVQDSSQKITPETLAALSQEIEQLQDQLSSIKEKEKNVRASLAALEAKPRLSVLRQDIQQLEEEKKVIQHRLESLHNSEMVQLSLEERSKREDEWRRWQRHAAIRSRICRDLWGRCAEVLPENTSALELWLSIAVANGAARSLWGLKEQPSNEQQSGIDATFVISGLHPDTL